MLNPTLPTPPKLHEMDRVPVDIAIEASQKRTRVMMAKAAELARVALDLEKELRWNEALSAYNDVCTYFKRILEVAESKDISDILFVVSLLFESKSLILTIFYSIINILNAWHTSSQ